MKLKNLIYYQTLRISSSFLIFSVHSTQSRAEIIIIQNKKEKLFLEEKNYYKTELRGKF
jgi:hypothetical protein